jgi:hypothetical protein
LIETFSLSSSITQPIEQKFEGASCSKVFSSMSSIASKSLQLKKVIKRLAHGVVSKRPVEETILSLSNEGEVPQETTCPLPEVQSMSVGMRGVRSPIGDVAAVLHRQATIRMAVYRPAKIPSPLTSYSDPETKQYTVVKPSTTRIQPPVRDRAVAERLFGIQVYFHFYPRKNLKKLAVRSRACLALGFAPGAVFRWPPGQPAPLQQ